MSSGGATITDRVLIINLHLTITDIMIQIVNRSVSSTAGLKVRRRGTADEPHTAMTCPAGATPDEYEEVDPEAYAAECAATEAEAAYKVRLIALIRERYDYDDEIAILANRDDGDATHAAEYAAYQQYRAHCKARARAEAGGR